MRRTGLAAALLLLVLGGAYLRDPPWAGAITSGMRPWEAEPGGVRYRWTTGRASFFVPAQATTMTVPLRAIFPGPDGRPVTVEVSVDDRWLADIELRQPDAWVRTSVPMPRRATSRRFRRVDLHVSRTKVGVFILGVETGEIELDQAGR
jgi:hypothetical protein